MSPCNRRGLHAYCQLRELPNRIVQPGQFCAVSVGALLCARTLFCNADTVLLPAEQLPVSAIRNAVLPNVNGRKLQDVSHPYHMIPLGLSELLNVMQRLVM